MKRNVDINEISDGRLYSSGDMVKADCHDCEGCSECCRGMGSSIILDSMDIWRIQKGIGKGFQALLEEGKIELNMADGMILPDLKMDTEREACPFLDSRGRCFIHACRPGLCRLSRWGDITRKMDLSISSRSMSAGNRTEEKSRSKSGWAFPI